MTNFLTTSWRWHGLDSIVLASLILEIRSWVFLCLFTSKFNTRTRFIPSEHTWDTWCQLPNGRSFWQKLVFNKSLIQINYFILVKTISLFLFIYFWCNAFVELLSHSLIGYRINYLNRKIIYLPSHSYTLQFGPIDTFIEIKILFYIYWTLSFSFIF